MPLRTSPYVRLSAILGLALSFPAFAQFRVGAGSLVDFGDATVDFGCTPVQVEGQLAATSAQLSGIGDFIVAAGGAASPGASQLTLGGDFGNLGSFAPGTSRVSIVDVCGDGSSQLAGATSFHELRAITATGKQLILPALVTQTIAQALTLQGAAGNLLAVRSTAPGQRARLAVANAAAQTIAFVDARDNQATAATIAPGPAALYNSIDAGNLINWFENPAGEPPPGGGSPAEPVPALDGIGRWLLIALLLATMAVSRRAPVMVRTVEKTLRRGRGIS